MLDQKYRDMVDERLSKNSPERFGNFTPEHAGYIIAQFISKAEKSIEILSGNFSDSFYDGISIKPILQQAAKRINANGGKIRIITVNGIRCKKLEMLASEINSEFNTDSKGKNEVVVYIPAKAKSPEKIKHFMVVDDMRYRLEEPHEVVAVGQVPACVKAEICCNDIQKASGLRTQFDAAWKEIGGVTDEQRN